MHSALISSSLPHNFDSYTPGFPRFLRIEVTAHLDPVGVVYQPVEDTVGKRGVADLFVPARYRQLRSQAARSAPPIKIGNLQTAGRSLRDHAGRTSARV